MSKTETSITTQPKLGYTTNMILFSKNIFIINTYFAFKALDINFDNN